MQTIVTTVKGKQHLAEKAREVALQLNVPYVDREDRSLEKLVERYGQQVTVVVGEKKISAMVGKDEFFFHPSMALLRIMNLLKGQSDRMAEAMAIRPGMKILDCTLGFATDALVAGFLAGPEGLVTGLESSPLVAMLVEQGMQRHRQPIHAGLDPEKAKTLMMMPEIIKRVQVISVNYNSYLVNLADNSYDVVYFDPMFRKPLQDSASMSPLRYLACPDRVESEAVREACRVAKSRVVLKEARNSGEFERLGFRVVPGGKYSSIAYGIIETQK